MTVRKKYPAGEAVPRCRKGEPAKAEKTPQKHWGWNTFGENGKLRKINHNKQKRGKEGILPMAGQIFMRVDEVASELGVSKPYAYKLIRKMNDELQKTGFVTIAGRIDRKFFYEKFYGTCERKEM